MRLLLVLLIIVCTGGFYAATAFRQTGVPAALASFHPEFFAAALPVALAFLAPALIAAACAGIAGLARRLGWRGALATAVGVLAAVGSALAYFGRGIVPSLPGA